MRNSIIKTSFLAVLLAAGAGVNLKAQHVLLDGTAKVESYNDPAGSTGLVAVTDLQGNPNYPASPDKVVQTKFIEYPAGSDAGAPPPGNVQDNYGIRISGLLTVDLDGDYVFAMSSDDGGEFWLSTDNTEANLVMIAHEPTWNPVRSFVTNASGGRTAGAEENVSTPIHLLKDTKYFFTGYMKEGGGGDNFSVAGRLATDSLPSNGSFPIFNAAVSTSANITSQPQSVAIPVGGSATFSVGVSGPAFFQWKKGGVAIPGATSQSYTLASAVQADNGTKYSVTVTPVTGAAVTSAEANVQVVGTRQYKQGILEYASWLSDTPDIATAILNLGTPIGSYAAGGGIDPSLRVAVDSFDSRVAYPDNSHEQYAGAMFGLFVPDQTGTYYFHLKSDDPGQLFFNPNGPALPDLVTDDDGDGVANSVVANETGCCNDFQPAGNVRTGGPFNLTKGTKYGIVGIYHEGGGDDYLQIAFTRDGVVTGLNETDLRNNSTIPSPFLEAINGITGPDLALASQPQNIHVEDKRSGSFSVTTTAAPAVTFQWQTAPAGSSTFTDVAGATSSSLTVNANLAQNNGQQYRVKVHAEGQDITSDIATLTVDPDVTAPTITSAYTAPNLDAVVVNFNEPITATGGSYTLTGGATVSSAESPSSTVVVVHTSVLTPNTSYTLTANGITDVSGNALTAKTITFTSSKLYTFPGAPFVKVVGKIPFERYDNNTTLATLQDRIDSGPPDFFSLLDTFEQAVDQAEGFASRKAGWFVPPTTGNYVFYTCSDDPNNLYLSTDSDPANKKLIAAESNWSSNRQWLSSPGGTNPDNKRSDRYAATQWPGGNTITLIANEPYYIEQRQAEGGGGDNGAATFKLSTEADPADGTASRIAGNAFFAYLDAATLPPIISKAPVGKNYNKGENITLTVEATGPGLTYQWFKNKKAIAGATSATLTINNADATAVGDYSIRVSNANGAVDTFRSDNAGRLIMNGAKLNIEAEDFNYGGGQTKAEASVTGYTGNAYTNIQTAVADVDFMDSPDESGAAAFSYSRFKTTDAHVIEMKGPADPADYNRGSWTVTQNYAVGWGSAGDWQNYTRTFPKGKYIVIAGTAHDGLSGIDILDGAGPAGDPAVYMVLSKVANPTIADGSTAQDPSTDPVTPGIEGGAQGLTRLGVFSSPGTGAWSSNDLVPLTDETTGAIKTIDLDGTTTLRVTFADPTGLLTSGTQDSDFFLFYCTDCADVVPIQISTSRTGTTLNITWTGGGTLESSINLGPTASWSAVAGQTAGSASVSTATGAHTFYRVKL